MTRAETSISPDGSPATKSSGNTQYRQGKYHRFERNRGTADSAHGRYLRPRPHRRVHPAVLRLTAGSAGVFSCRRRAVYQRPEQLPGNDEYIVNRFFESLGVGLGRVAVAADLAHELQCRLAHFCIRRLRFDVSQYLDAPAHLISLPLTHVRALCPPRA